MAPIHALLRFRYAVVVRLSRYSNSLFKVSLMPEGSCLGSRRGAGL
jgi:hypothetical protein